VNWNHVRIVQPGDDMRLMPEPLLEAGILGHQGREDLQGDFPVVRGVIRPEDLAHAAFTERSQQPIATKRRSVHANLPRQSDTRVGQVTYSKPREQPLPQAIGWRMVDAAADQLAPGRYLS